MSIRQSWASKWLLAIAILFVVGIATSQQVPTEALKAQLAPPQETPSAAQNKITARSGRSSSSAWWMSSSNSPRTRRACRSRQR